MKKDVLVHHPQIVSVMGGTNDVYQQQSLEEIRENFLALYERLDKAEIQVFIGLPLPIDDPLEKSLALWRNWLQEFAKKEQLNCINFYEDFIREDGKIRIDLFVDGCHPNITGYELMGERSLKTLRKFRKN